MAGVDLEKDDAGEREKAIFGDANHSSQQLSEYSSSHLSGDGTSAPGGEPTMDERSIHGIRWALAVISVIWVDFLFAMDNTIVSGPIVHSKAARVLVDQWLARKCTAGYHQYLRRN